MYNNLLNILKKELVPALGCTEPIAIAYAAAKARELLGDTPEEMIVQCSGNIIKNVKGVVVPVTGNMKGIETSAILGAVGGDASKKLEVLTGATPDDIEKTKELLKLKICKVLLKEDVESLYIKVTEKKGDDWAAVTISGGHTDIVKEEKNGQVVFEKINLNQNTDDNYNIEGIDFKSIYDFANEVAIDDIKELIDRQIKYNTEISLEGMNNKYGASVGETLVENYGNDIKVLAKAYSAAGSDARMSGCTMPVIINSGSGNQGITASIPVIMYAKHLGVSDEKMYRALVLSNLTSIYIKSGIGKLSAFCGAVSAASGCGAGISYLYDAPYETITKTITNTLANVSGIVCDGAKPSCAAKIASSVDAAILAHNMAMKGRTFNSGEGLIKDTVEDTIKSICKMGKDGMKSTDVEILNIMIE
jgi:L-cysteine desulfidase